MKITVRIPGAGVTVELPEEDCKSCFRRIAMDLVRETTMVSECETANEPLTVIESEEPEAVVGESITDEDETEEWNSDERPEEEESRYERFEVRGLLYIQCQGCGQKIFVSAHEPIDHFICRECDWVTLFDQPLKRVNVRCACCGQSYYLKTNIKDDQFDVNCRNCKAPTTVQFNERKDQYYSIGEEE